MELRTESLDSTRPSHLFEFRPFKILKSLITYEQFESFVNSPDGATNTRWWHDLPIIGYLPPESYLPNSPQKWDFDRYPRVNVSGYDAMAFTKWLSARIGFEVRLPFESELQYALRTIFHSSYDEDDPLQGNLGLVTLENSGFEHTENVLDVVDELFEWCLADLNEFYHVYFEPSSAMCLLKLSDWTRSYTFAHEHDENTGFRIVCPSIS